MARVLIATDGSACAIGAARRALELLSPPDEVTILCVVDIRSEVAVGGMGLVGGEPLAGPFTGPGGVADLDGVLTAEADEAVRRTVAALGERGETCRRRVSHGDPASEIVRIADEGGYDLVVVGTHGSGFVKRVLVGSVSSHVVHHAQGPVLVIRGS